MTYFGLSLFVVSLFIPANCIFPNGSCNGYYNLSEPHRNRGFTSTSFPGYPFYDTNLFGNWWRFVGIGGDQIAKSCVALYIGGTSYPISLAITPPTSQSSTSTVGSSCGQASGCCSYSSPIEIVLCPGNFYVYKLGRLAYPYMAYVTYHSNCTEMSCGPLAKCTTAGGCICLSGYRIPSGHLPSGNSYGCQDINECVESPSICGPNSNCTNTPGAYICDCLQGYRSTNPGPSVYNPCKDINECSTGICAVNGVCTNTPGSSYCTCNKGYQLNYNLTECLDIDECVVNATICGPDANCTNSIGAYSCTCNLGFRLTNPDFIASISNPCIDIDECAETPDLCGRASVCANVPGTFHCSCQDGYFPSTGLQWVMDVSVCRSVKDILATLIPPEGQTKQTYFLNKMDQELKDNPNTVLPAGTVTNSMSATLEVSGVNDQSKKSQTTNLLENEKTGNLVLGISERLVSALVDPTQNQSNQTIHSDSFDMSLQTIGPGTEGAENVTLSAKGHTMDINLQALAQNNNGSAAAVFLTISGIETLLSNSFFQSENQTEMFSDIITATLPKTNNTQLSQPVNFTIQHKRSLSEPGLVTCVYWEKTIAKGVGGQEKENRQWSESGCWVAFTDENYTVCSCSHLSTFALILQTGQPPVEDPFIEWVNKVCVVIGLVFLALAILTFLLCSWNPKINNTARLHLCICLFLTQLLLLFDKRYVDNKLICKCIAGLLHFLVVGSFVWMLLEGLQLHLLVKSLSKVQVIQRDGLPRPYLYLIGYGVPTVIVGISACINSAGYGGTKSCWLSSEKYFSWALTGPVIAVLVLNWILFCLTLWSLRPTLASMRSDVSQSKDTRLIVFKILSQFVILGCTWILGFYQSNIFFQYLFILLNSQQGTFLYIVHCLFNKEVREQYYRFLTCSAGSPSTGGSVKEIPSISEDLDKTEEKNGIPED